MNNVGLRNKGYDVGSAATTVGSRKPISKKILLRSGERNAITMDWTSLPR